MYIGKLRHTNCCLCCELEIGLKVFWIILVIGTCFGLVSSILILQSATNGQAATIGAIFVTCSILGILTGYYGYTGASERNMRKVQISFLSYLVLTIIIVGLNIAMSSFLEAAIRMSISSYLLYHINNYYKILEWGAGYEEPQGIIKKMCHISIDH